MTTSDGLTPLVDDKAELAAEIAAQRAWSTYALAPLLFALVERQAVDFERVMTFNRTMADIFRQTATRASDPIEKRGCMLAASIFDAVETTARNMLTAPAGAGRA